MCRWHGDSSSMRVFTRPHCCPPRSSRALRRAWRCQALEAAHALWPAYLRADLAGLEPIGLILIRDVSAISATCWNPGRQACPSVRE